MRKRVRPDPAPRWNRRHHSARPFIPSGPRRRQPTTFQALASRIAIVTATIAVVGASPSAVADLASPSPTQRPTPAEAPAIPQPGPPALEESTPSPPPITLDPCALSPELCPPPLEPLPVEDASGVPSCVSTGRSAPAGSLTVVRTATRQPRGAPEVADVVRYRVEVEDGIAVDGACFAESVAAILGDDRGWRNADIRDFVRVDDDSFDFRLVLASPDTTNALCYPAATGGKYSCRNQDRVVLNLMRWKSGADDFEDDMDTYRHYLVNHEVGHFLGRGHRSCPGPGQPAPVMMQQTKTVADCIPNGWPTTDER